MEDFVWQPNRDFFENSRVSRFMKSYGIRTWQELIRRSTEDIEWFWNAALRDLKVEWFKPYHKLYDDSWGMAWTKWFLGGKINIVHNCLDRHIRDGKGDKTALFFERDDGTSAKLTYRELYEKVNIAAAAMKKAGVIKGEIIAQCMPISPEAVVIMFAAMKIGAVPMQLTSRLSPELVSDLLNRARIKTLFINDGYHYGGKIIDLSPTIQAVGAKVPSLRKIIVIERLCPNSLLSAEQCISWNNFLMLGKEEMPPKTAELDAESPALILLSSGTTGKMKIIIHTHGGIIAQTAKEIGYAFDCRENDVFFWFTNLGWMMAPWEIIGVQFFGGAYVLYEGSPNYPDSHRLFEIIERYGVSVFGFTPAGIAVLSKTEDCGCHNLSSLRLLGSTGAPLDKEKYLWFFKTFGQSRCPIINITGGTELIGCLLSPLPVMPLKVSTVGGPGLGMAVALFDENGNSVGPQKEGILVCKKPFPSMTRGFLGVGERNRYLATYFEPWPNIWNHHDRAMYDRDGLWYLRGRDDDLINKGGVKHDPLLIEETLVSFPGPPKIKEAVAIGVDDPLYGERIVCFVVIDPVRDLSLNGVEGIGLGETDPAVEEFKKTLKTYVGKHYDPLGRPDEIYIVDALPKTFTAKIPRKKYQLAYEGKDLGDLSSIDNPQGFEVIKNLRKN